VDGIKASRTNMLAFIVCVTALVCLVCTWALIKALDSGFTTKALTRKMLSLQHTTTVEARSLPRFDHGPEYGISLWLYANSLPNAVKDSAIVSHVGKPVISYRGNRPVVGVNFPTVSGGATATVYFEHVSTKRWVHLIAVHSNRTVTLFKDGELYSVTHLGAGAAGDVDILSGALTVGGSPVDAFVSNLAVINHFPSTALVKATYRKGPVTRNRLMSWIGMASYNVRSPIYRIG
jgi:hypothetical protein